MSRRHEARSNGTTRTLAWIGALAMVMSAACAPAATTLPTQPGATFQAHLIHGGFMVDAMRGGAPTVASAPSWLNLGSGPALVLDDGAAKGEAVLLDGPGRACVRKAATSDAPLVGCVSPEWDDNAIRLTIAPVGHRPLHADVFVREDPMAGPSVLTRDVALSTDVEGVYRAALRYPDGTPAGWLRVRVGLHQPAPEIFDAALPPSVDEGLATASAAALDEEVSWIEDHSYGVHRGTKRP